MNWIWSYVHAMLACGWAWSTNGVLNKPAVIYACFVHSITAICWLFFFWRVLIYCLKSFFFGEFFIFMLTNCNHPCLIFFSLSNALNTEPQPKPPDETAQNSTSSDHGELAVPKAGDSCELLSEASLEVPATNETNTFLDELQNDTSKTMNEAPQIQPQKKLSTARTGMRGRKAGYSRRGKGRGKWLICTLLLLN